MADDRALRSFPRSRVAQRYRGGYVALRHAPARTSTSRATLCRSGLPRRPWAPPRARRWRSRVAGRVDRGPRRARGAHHLGACSRCACSARPWWPWSLSGVAPGAASTLGLEHRHRIIGTEHRAQGLLRHPRQGLQARAPPRRRPPRARRRGRPSSSWSRICLQSAARPCRGQS